MSIQHTVYCTRPCTFHQQYQTPQHTNDSTLKSLVTKICTKQRTQLQISPKFTGCVQLGSVQGSDHTKIYRVHQLGSVQGLVEYHTEEEHEREKLGNQTPPTGTKPAHHIRGSRKQDGNMMCKYIESCTYQFRLSNRQTRINITHFHLHYQHTRAYIQLLYSRCCTFHFHRHQLNTIYSTTL